MVLGTVAGLAPVEPGVVFGELPPEVLGVVTPVLPAAELPSVVEGLLFATHGQDSRGPLETPITPGFNRTPVAFPGIQTQRGEVLGGTVSAVEAGGGTGVIFTAALVGTDCPGKDAGGPGVVFTVLLVPEG